MKISTTYEDIGMNIIVSSVAISVNAAMVMVTFVLIDGGLLALFGTVDQVALGVTLLALGVGFNAAFLMYISSIWWGR